jgi:hypothetical protein
MALPRFRPVAGGNLFDLDSRRCDIDAIGGQNLQALEQRSSLVQSLTHPVELAWLIHPAEVAPRLRRLLNR